MGRSRRANRKKLKQLLPELIDVYRYFGADLRSQWPRISWGLSAMLVGVVMRLAEPWPLKFVLDSILVRSSDAAATSSDQTSEVVVPLAICAAAVIFIAAFRGFADYASRVAFFTVGNKIVIRVRDRLFRHIQRLPMTFHDQARQGDLITRITRDVNLLRDVTATAMLPLLGSVLVLLGMFGVMLWISPVLTLISLTILPLYWITTVRLGRKIRETTRKQRQRESGMASIASEAFHATATTRTLGLNEHFADAFNRKNDQAQGADLKASRQSLRLARLVDLLLAVATGAVLFTGALWAHAGALTVGELVLFLVYLKRSFKPAQEFAKYTARIAKAIAAGERIIELLELAPEPDIVVDANAVPTIRSSDELRPSSDNAALTAPGSIEFDRIRYGHDSRQLTLKNLELNVPPAATVALMGASGVGKSTLLQLLLRFYLPLSGSIRIGGRDIQEIPLAELRRTCPALLQPPMLFQGTIWENLVMCRPDVDRATAIQMAESMEVDEFVAELPQGWETPLSESSGGLSRGQRQRLALARIGLIEAPYLLLDEPTTGLDERNAQRVTDSILSLCQHRTAIIVTHDIRLARRSDIVAFLDRGEISEWGTHDELWRARGRYFEWCQQMEAAQRELNTTAGNRI